MSFFNICWEGTKLVVACCMIVSANVLYVSICKNIKILTSYFFVNLFALSFTQDMHYSLFDIIFQFLSV